MAKFKSTRPKPRTELEKNLVSFALAVYKQQRSRKIKPATAWSRINNLVDDAVVTEVIKDESPNE